MRTCDDAAASHSDPPLPAREPGPGALSPELLASLRAGLEEQRRFRLDQLLEWGQAWLERPARVRERAAVGQTEVHIQLVASARMVLAEVEAALERMARGDYGRCQRCARTIAPERLEIVPQARYCGGCQRVREAGR